MKKFLLFFTSFLLFSLPASAIFFPDLPSDHQNYEAIEYLRGKDVVEGYPDGTFGPDISVNRAEAMKIITLAMNLDISESYEPSFPDVKGHQWFFPYVMSARYAGIVEGYTDGEFKPGRTVSLSEALKMLIESAEVELPVPGSAIFADVPRNEWFAPYMLYARNHNMIFADDYGKVYPHKEMDRASFSELAYRMMVILESGDKPFPLEKDWPEYVGANIPFKIKYDLSEWQVFEHMDGITFMRPDKEFSQFSPFRVYPNSAIVNVTLDKNSKSLSKNDYFSNIKNAFSRGEHKNFDFEGMPALEVLIPHERIVDWYIYLKDGRVLAVYTRYGEGFLGFQHQQVIRAMLRTLEFNETGNVSRPDYEDILSNIFKNILVEGKGMSSIDLLPDKSIIETDSIGVGTGPIDYYYSDTVGYTFKYERAGDVILAQRQGRTTAF